MRMRGKYTICVHMVLVHPYFALCSDALAGETEEESLLRFMKLHKVLPVSFVFVISKLSLLLCVM
jgi:hypothetical protein